jgi:hypothetical protein
MKLGEERGRNEEKDEGFLVIQVVDGGFPRLAQFVVIFPVEIIRMFFYFQSFLNEARGVVRD